jgi:CheY-like chemotaxis protein/anti-sigma regulatory factor (Ser/Thr protein kinase)
MAKVLLAEDSPTQAFEIKMLLEDASHEVELAENGQVALNALATNLFDVVITDLEMPEVNGLQLVETMQLDFDHIPAILITNRGSEDLAAQALRSGAASYVPKTHMKTLLIDAVTDVLGVIRTDASYAKLIATLKKNVFVFDLPNDGQLINPLVGLMIQVVSGMGTLGGVELVRLGVAIEHAVLNAMFRGNLELSREQTPSDQAIVYEDATSEEIQERMATAPYRDRMVNVEVVATEADVRVTVRDQGNGFDTSIVPTSENPDDLESEGGRGLVMMSSFVDHVQFNDQGNEVTLIKNRRERK